jgi:hypothetical protein
VKVEEIQDMIDVDSKLDKNKLDLEALKIPSLHAKYYRLFMDAIRLSRALEQNLKDVKKTRSDYYLGKAEDEVYKEERLNFKVLKADLDLYLNADKKYAAALARYDSHRLTVTMLEDFIKALNNRSFLISNAISWAKFQAGAM